MASNELYFSVDVEADGPIPGPFSMVSFGMSAGLLRSLNGNSLTVLDVDTELHQFYAELKPISEKWDPEALAVSGLSREGLLANGRDPVEAMTAACEWVQGLAKHYDARPVFAAYPLGFDWMFWYWYAVNFSNIPSPFGFSAHIDMKSLYAALAEAPISRSTKRYMPKSLMSKRPHTHNALDDAIEQGDLLRSLLTWDGSR